MAAGPNLGGLVGRAVAGYFASIVSGRTIDALGRDAALQAAQHALVEVLAIDIIDGDQSAE